MTKRDWLTAEEMSKVVGKVLSSPLQTEIIVDISNAPLSFSELQKKLEMTSGNLNYHLLRLGSAGLLSKDPQNRYSITPLGRDIAKIVRTAIKASLEIEPK
jgi:DNA-binding HxlR family transcriptional regulator